VILRIALAFSVLINCYNVATLLAMDDKAATAELVQAAHRVLDMGFDCAKSGAERAACHAQLTTAIKHRVKE